MCAAVDCGKCGALFFRFTECVIVRRKMETLKQWAVGDFRPAGLRRYLGIEAAIFWGLIFLCWTLYPVENKYSIMTHTFSFLGSFETKHNPQFWWLFSAAMMFWGVASVPLVLHLRRRFSAISNGGAAVGAVLMLAGCVGISLIGVFPDAHGRVIGNAEWTDIHEKAAIAVAVGFILGIAWYGLLLLKDRLAGGQSGFDHRKTIWPYAFWLAVLVVVGYFLVTWEFVYADMKAAAEAAGEPIGSAWSEALNTRYSFPLWENIWIYSNYVFLAWLSLAVPEEVAAPGAAASQHHH